MYLIHNHCIKFFVNCSARKGSLIGNKKCDLSISFMSSKYKNPSSTKYKNPSFTKNIKILHLPNIKILHLPNIKILLQQNIKSFIY
jgi:hypothetical protein